MKNGLLITFEGLDKVGKSTQVERLSEYLKSKGHRPILVREPGSSEAGERIRTILADPSLKGKIAPLCEFFLYSASRAQLVIETIKPALERGDIVIADRYYDSSSAYQGYGRGIDMKFISAVNAMATDEILPDLTVLLYIHDFSPGSGHANNRFSPSLFDDRLEQEFSDFRKQVQQGFLDLAELEKDRFLIIDASEKREQIAKKIVTRVDVLLKNR
jgi:dTMP kinase